VFLSFQRQQSQRLNIVMQVVRGYVHHVQMVVKVPVKGAKEVVKMDVRAGAQVVVLDHVVVAADKAAKDHVWNIVQAIVRLDAKQVASLIVGITV